VVLAAKRPAVFASLQRAMGAHRIEKDYLALVHGRPSPSRGTIDAALDRDPWDRRRIAVTDRGGVPAVTRYERIAVSTIPDGTRPPAPPGGDRAPIHRGIDRRRAWRPPDDPPFLPVSRPDRVRSRSLVSLLKCRLVTGRMHQIRVHLSSRGWPIVGDAAYGSRRSAGHDAPRIGFPRQALHAWRLSLTHPVTREKLVVSAPLPGDMSALMAALGLELDQALEGRGPT
jgi:23S rRNA pseudouridine1911/1915/1917 synthase